MRPFWYISIVIVVAIGVTASFLFTKPEIETTTSPVPVPMDATIHRNTIASSTIGYSVEGRPIELYLFGSGTTTVLLVGGIHGGYEWNSVLLAQKFIEHFTASGTPEGVRVAIIPNLNPDGTFLVTGKSGSFAETDVNKNVPLSTGRFNANNVDLNRNFDCKWQPQSTWQNKTVSGGKAPFSEPEAQTLRDLVTTLRPVAAVFWHSQANAVYASECEDGILPGTLRLMATYATHAQYQSVTTFDAYPVTGDAEGWLASIGIPAITVELATRTGLDWEQNRAAIAAVLSEKSW
jgi:predicted deacylase